VKQTNGGYKKKMEYFKIIRLRNIVLLSINVESHVLHVNRMQTLSNKYNFRWYSETKHPDFN